MNRFRVAALATVLIALLAGCATHRPADRLALPQASVMAIEAHRAFLASDALAGRATGTPGYDAAAEYVAAQFRAYGVEAAGTDGYMQQVPFVTSTLVPEGTQMRLHRGRTSRTLVIRDDFITFPDPVEPHVQIRAPLVFVGYAIRAQEMGHDDYADIDAVGRIVVMVGGAPASFPVNERTYYGSNRTKAEAAVLAGAVGIIMLRAGDRRTQAPWDVIARNFGAMPSLRWVGPDGGVAGHYPQLRGTALVSDDLSAELFTDARMSHEEIVAAMTAGDPVPAFPLHYEIELERRSTHETMTSPNVVGMVRGSDPSLADEVVVYSAHLDHLGVGRPVDGDDIYNGAYDNAMGTAIMMETARLFASLPTPPRRTVVFAAVTAEERGLLGSQYFARYPSMPGRIVANVNVDMPLFLYPIRDLVGYGAELTSLGAVAARAARAEGFVMSPDPMPEQVIFVRSDHYSFASEGVPAIFMMTGHGSTDPEVDGSAKWQEFMSTYYHRPGDDLGLPVHWPSVQRFTQVKLRIGLEVAEADAPPSWIPGNVFTRAFAR